MLTFHYTARNPSTGQKVRAEVQADSEQAAAKLVRGEGLVPISVKLKDGGVSGNFSKRLKHVKIRDRVLFSRQLSTLINAGLPLVQSLRSVNDQTVSKPLKVVISSIISSVEGGSTLAAAMGKYPDVFNQVYLSMIAAGETSGTLDASIDWLFSKKRTLILSAKFVVP
jgi:type IV pilus assembly protein PilC